MEDENRKPIDQSDEIVNNSTEQEYSFADDSDESTSATNLAEPISWQSSEGEQRHRSAIWYVMVLLVTAGLVALAVFLLNNLSFAILAPVMALALIVMSTRPPRMVNYSISPKGVYVGDKLFDFSEFRAFGITLKTAHNSATLLPVKRFSPALTIYFDDDQGEKIVDMLGARLPIVEVKPDFLDKLSRLLQL